MAAYACNLLPSSRLLLPLDLIFEQLGVLASTGKRRQQCSRKKWGGAQSNMRAAAHEGSAAAPHCETTLQLSGACVRMVERHPSVVNLACVLCHLLLPAAHGAAAGAAGWACAVRPGAHRPGGGGLAHPPCSCAGADGGVLGGRPSRCGGPGGTFAPSTALEPRKGGRHAGLPAQWAAARGGPRAIAERCMPSEHKLCSFAHMGT